MDEARQTLAALAQARGESLALLSVALGRNAAYLQQYLRRGSPRVLDERDRRFLAAHFGVDESRLGGPARAPETTVAVPILDVAASAGPGASVEGERQIATLDLPLAMLREAGVSGAHASLVRARGDSMAPTILDGDRLLVDGADRRLAAAPQICVARRGETLVVKRFARVAGGVRVTSDNPLWPDETLDAADAPTVIGRVKLLLRAPR